MFFALTKMGLAPALAAKYFWIELACSAPRARSGRIAITIVLGTRQGEFATPDKRFSPPTPSLSDITAIAYNPLAFRAAGMDIATLRHW